MDIIVLMKQLILQTKLSVNFYNNYEVVTSVHGQENVHLYL